MNEYAIHLENDFAVEPSHFLDCFDLQVRRAPDTTAIVYGDEKLSYRELQALSSVIAQKLVDLGIKPHDVVAVIFPRDQYLIPLLVAIMRVGASYVPIESTHPQKNIDLIIEDASPQLIVCNESTLSIADKYTGIPNWSVDGQALHHTATSSTSHNFNRRGSTAYIIYTSGSTGRPKGVRIPHSALFLFLQSIQQTLQCEANDRFAAITTICFDISGLEMFLPLTIGAAVVVIPREICVDGEKLSKTLQQHRVSVLQATPATYRLLLAGNWQKTESLNTVLCGGEAISSQLAKQLIPMADNVWNVYGPTEATIWCTIKKITENIQFPPTIGKPLAGYECFIVDDKKQILPAGKEGELCIGGMALAEGYHNAEEKTRERFIDCPINGKQQRIYLTGDKAVVNEAGEIEYLGRIDFQVKIRGYRVELPEIEFIANNHGSVSAFAAISRQDSSGENAIYGYVTSHPGEPLDANELRSYIANHLPAYMVPSVITQLEAMPLNTNGKIDRHALPKVKDIPQVDASQKHFSKDLDKQIYHAWCDTLGIADCEMSDNFFDLGGHSIGAFLFIKKVEEIVSFSVPLVLLFNHPSFDAFMHSLRNEGGSGMGVKVALNKNHTAPEKLPILYFICGIDLYQNLANELADDFNSFALYVEKERAFFEDNDKSGVVVSTKELASHYVKTILSEAKGQPVVLCGISYGGLLALEVATQLEKAGLKSKAVFMLDSTLPSGWQKTKLLKTWQLLRRVFFKGLDYCSEWPIKGFNRVLKKLHRITHNKRVAIEQEYRLANAIEAAKVEEMNYSGDVVLIKALEVGRQSRGIIYKEDYGWQEALNRTIEIHTVEGDHLGIIDNSNAVNVAAIISQKSGPKNL